MHSYFFGSSPSSGENFLEFFPAQKSRKYIMSPRNFCRFSAEVSSLLPHRTEVRRSTSRRVRSEGGSQCPPRSDESAGENLIDLGRHNVYLQSLNFLAEKRSEFSNSKTPIPQNLSKCRLNQPFYEFDVILNREKNQNPTFEKINNRLAIALTVFPSVPVPHPV